MVSRELPVRVACYARVSTEDQAERQTVAAQTDFLRRYCELHQLPVAGVYVDDGVSGATPLPSARERSHSTRRVRSGASCFRSSEAWPNWSGRRSRSG